MAYKRVCGSSQVPPFFSESMANSQFYAQEDPLDSQDTTWIDNVHPELRSSGQIQDEIQDSQMAWQKQRPLDRFMFEPERNFFTADPMQHHRQGFLQGLNGPSAPISSLPQAARVRMPSPCLSYSDPASSSGDDRSPGPEAEWYNSQYSPQVQPREDYSVPHATSYLGQGFPDQWLGASQSQFFTQTTGYPCVNMSQVQVFADPQEVSWDAEEGYAAMEMKADYGVQTDNRSIKVDSCPIDEGLGDSIKSEGSPAASGSAHHDIELGSEMDAEGEEEDIEHNTITTEAPSDTEYSPRSTRTRKRRPSKPSSPIVKRSRVAKTTPKGKGQVSCKSCDHTPFKDAPALQRHIATSHTRAYICVFAFAGCPSTFASKNEWKRHVSCQHLNLSAWVCELGVCGKKASEFNRKDLFTQHLRRMHAPFSVKRQNKKNAEWEERLKQLQVSCLVVKRHPPTRLACPLTECGMHFDGSGCWDDRMEHVGKHLEKAATALDMDVEQGDDDLLVSWAMAERIIEGRPGGGFKLALNNGARVTGDDIDADADGEDDV